MKIKEKVMEESSSSIRRASNDGTAILYYKGREKKIQSLLW
jgi:hypothetical protein